MDQPVYSRARVWQVTLDARAIWGGAVAVFAILSAAGLIQDLMLSSGAASTKIWLLDVDAEQSIYTWASVLLLAFNALLLLVLSLASPKHQFAWLSLAVLFLILSMDEVLDLHNKVSLSGAWVQQLAPWIVELNFSWTIAGAGLVLVLGLLYLPFVLSLEPRTRSLIVLAGFIYVSGAIGVELAAGEAMAIFGRDSLWYRLPTTLEESLEALGQIILLSALLGQCRGLRLTLASNRG